MSDATLAQRIAGDCCDQQTYFDLRRAYLDERALVEEASRTISVLHEQLAQVTAERDKLRVALDEISKRGPVPGYDAADALRLRLVATQSIARAALA